MNNKSASGSIYAAIMGIAALAFGLFILCPRMARNKSQERTGDTDNSGLCAHWVRVATLVSSHIGG
jgi:phosphate/sulfate permease